MLVWALARERDTSSCGHGSENGATVSKAAPPIIPSIPSFFMIGLRPPKAHSKAQRHQCSKIKSGQGVAKVGRRRGRKIWSPSGSFDAPAGRKNEPCHSISKCDRSGNSVGAGSGQRLHSHPPAKPSPLLPDQIAVTDKQRHPDETANTAILLPG